MPDGGLADEDEEDEEPAEHVEAANDAKGELKCRTRNKIGPCNGRARFFGLSGFWTEAQNKESQK